MTNAIHVRILDSCVNIIIASMMSYQELKIYLPSSTNLVIQGWQSIILSVGAGDGVKSFMSVGEENTEEMVTLLSSY